MLKSQNRKKCWLCCFCNKRIDQPDEEQGAEDDPGQEAHENAVYVVSSDNAKLHSKKRKLRIPQEEGYFYCYVRSTL